MEGSGTAGAAAVDSGPIATGKGVTDEAIFIGVPYFDTSSSNAGMAALTGRDDWVDEDTNRQKSFQAVIDHLNENGGVRGRKIIPIYYSTNAAEYLSGPDGRAREVQRMCATFTEDNQVFAIMPVRGNVPHDSIYDCARQKQVPFVSLTFGVAPVDEERFSRLGKYYYYPDGMLIERREQYYVRELAARGFFEKDARFGLMIDGSVPAIGRVADRVLKPGLERAGANVVSEIVYPDWIDSPWQSYVLEFQRQRVTHVVWSTSSGLSFPAIFFMRSAENQQFRPRYALASDLSPAGTSDLAPERQLERSVAVGWAPNDEDQNEDQIRRRGPISEADALCHRIAESSGQSYQRGACQGFFWLDHMLERASALTADGLADVVANAGTSSPVVSTFQISHGPGRHDGAGLVRYLEFNTRCGCFEYKNEPHVP